MTSYLFIGGSQDGERVIVGEGISEVCKNGEKYIARKYRGKSNNFIIFTLEELGTDKPLHMLIYGYKQEDISRWV